MLAWENSGISTDSNARITLIVRDVLPPHKAANWVGPARARANGVGEHVGGGCDAEDKPLSHDTSRIAWPKLMARAGEEFPLECPGCGGASRRLETAGRSRLTSKSTSTATESSQTRGINEAATAAGLGESLRRPFNNATAAGNPRFYSPRLCTAGRADPAAQGMLIGPEAVAEGPLTGLSFAKTRSSHRQA